MTRGSWGILRRHPEQYDRGFTPRHRHQEVRHLSTNKTRGKASGRICREFRRGRAECDIVHAARHQAFFGNLGRSKKNFDGNSDAVGTGMTAEYTNLLPSRRRSRCGNRGCGSRGEPHPCIRASRALPSPIAPAGRGLPGHGPAERSRLLCFRRPQFPENREFNREFAKSRRI